MYQKDFYRVHLCQTGSYNQFSRAGAGSTGEHVLAYRPIKEVRLLLEEVGTRFGVTRERVRQIVKHTLESPALRQVLEEATAA